MTQIGPVLLIALAWIQPDSTAQPSVKRGDGDLERVRKFISETTRANVDSSTDPRIRRDGGTGTLWFSWKGKPSVAVAISEETGRIVNFSADKAVARQSPVPPQTATPLTRKEVAEIVHRTVGLASADRSKWTYLDGPLSDPNSGPILRERVYEVRGGRLADRDFALLFIDRFTGDVSYYFNEWKADRWPSDGPIIKASDALKRAQTAFHKVADPYLLPGTEIVPTQDLPGVAYRSFDLNHEPSRLAYSYVFRVGRESFNTTMLASQLGFDVVVDAVTGEIWRAECVVTAIGRNQPGVRSERMAACHQMVKDPANYEVMKLLLAARPVQTRLFHCASQFILPGRVLAYDANGTIKVTAGQTSTYYEVPKEGRESCARAFARRANSSLGQREGVTVQEVREISSSGKRRL